MSDKRYKPTNEYRYWLYEPEGDGMTYYRTREERDIEAQKAIECYLDDEWSTDVEFVSAGEVTHYAQVTEKIRRPADEDIDEEGGDGDGMDWPEGMDWRGNYTLAPL